MIKWLPWKRSGGSWVSRFIFLLMGLTTCLVHNKCLKFKQSTGFNTIQAFTTLLILCYVSVLEACIELIAPRAISTTEGSGHVQWISDPSFDYFGSRHGILGFLSYVIILLYVIPLPILLLFPSVLYKSRYFSKFKPIYDTFWDPYKPNFWFYLGFRLIFRWIPFSLASNVRAPINVFVTNILLVLLLVLQISIQPFQTNGWTMLMQFLYSIQCYSFQGPFSFGQSTIFRIETLSLSMLTFTAVFPLSLDFWSC